MRNMLKLLHFQPFLLLQSFSSFSKGKLSSEFLAAPNGQRCFSSCGKKASNKEETNSTINISLYYFKREIAAPFHSTYFSVQCLLGKRAPSQKGGRQYPPASVFAWSSRWVPIARPASVFRSRLWCRVPYWRLTNAPFLWFLSLISLRTTINIQYW